MPAISSDPALARQFAGTVVAHAAAGPVGFVAGLPKPLDDGPGELPGQRRIGGNRRHGGARSVDTVLGTPIFLMTVGALSQGKSFHFLDISWGRAPKLF